MTVVGTHYLIDVFKVPSDLFAQNDSRLMRISKRAIEISKSTILDQCVHHFTPHGMTAIFLLSESHCSIHTWPEHQQVKIDLFSCAGEGPCEDAANYIHSEFERFGCRIEMKQISR